MTFASIRQLLLVLLLGGCEGMPTKTVEIADVRMQKIETPLAVEFCSALLESPKRGCAMQTQNTHTKQWSCVIVILPGDGEAAAHEAGGHCTGYDH